MWEQGADKTRVPNSKKLYILLISLGHTEWQTLPSAPPLKLWRMLTLMRTSGQEVAPITATSMHQIFSFCPYGSTPTLFSPWECRPISTCNYPRGGSSRRPSGGDPPHPQRGCFPSLFCIFVLSGRWPWLFPNLCCSFSYIYIRILWKLSAIIYIYSARVLFKQS